MDWLVTFNALKSVYMDEAFSNIAVNEAIEQHPGCSTGFVRAFVKGVIRDSLRLDHYIDTLAEKGLKGIKPRTLIVIRMGLYAIENMDSVPDHAAVNQSVKLAQKVAKGTDRFVNAILRNFIRKRDEIKVDSLSLKYAFPEELTAFLQNQYGDETDRLLAALNKPAPMVVRANLNRTTREEAIETLEKAGVLCVADGETLSGIICEGGNVVGSEAFRKGFISVQSLSSIIAIEKLGPKPDSSVLDMCAAPGGKTSAMAEMMRNTGKITACDVYDHRLELIKAQSDRLGITNIETVLLDGSKHDASYDGRFDYVLADVPCSGLGVIRSKPEIKLRTSVNEYKDLSEIQYAILKNAVEYVRDGGYIEYSTCTINRNENEAVVNRVLEEYNFLHVVENEQILPYNNMIGFYYCIMQKNVL